VNITAIILAGGFGTRLKGVVPELPKPMAPILGRPFLEYLMDYWIKQGVNHFILSVGYKKNVIINHFSDEYHGASIEYSTEELPLGTGGAFLKAARKLSDTFLLLNGDTFIEMDLNKMIGFHYDKESDWTLSVIKLNRSDRYMEIEMTDNGKIISLDSFQDQDFQLANGGAYLINPSVLEKMKWEHDIYISLENELLPEFSSSGGNLFGIECSGKFIDIGVPEDYFRAQKVLIS
jgi:D-glycero-alpha-D-manno-heptose 1-phosphate guanylyltransferase